MYICVNSSPVRPNKIASSARDEDGFVMTRGKRSSRIISCSSLQAIIISSSSTNDGQSGQQQGEQEGPQLLPGLPDHLAHLCLAAGVHPRHLFSVCRSWRRLLYSPSFPPHLSMYAVLSGPASGADPDTGPIGLSSYDPIQGKWAPLPAPPLPADLLLTHPSFIARRFPVQSAAAAGRLILVAATTHGLAPGIPRPLVFDPAAGRWHAGPALPAPRRWCAVGSAGGSLYVASGVGSEYNAEMARSAERWDVGRVGSGWEPVSPLKDGRFSREPAEMAASKGRLCMVNLMGRGVKEGIVFDLGSGRWDEMPAGMLAGWTGPATVVEEGGPIYVVDEASGVLRRYEWEGDAWTVVVESEKLRGAVGIAGGGGRICVTCAGGAAVAVVDVATERGRVRTVLPPEGRRVVALHVLPRMSRDES